MNWRIRRKKFPGIKDRDITTDILKYVCEWLYVVFLGGRGEARCFGEVEIVFEVDPPPPPPFQAFPEINWTNGELKKASGPQALALVLYSKLTRNDFPVCTKVNPFPSKGFPIDE